ncbi:MAG: ribonuclease P protein component [Candidatus Sulfotelmatobacter sp.]
MPLPSTLEILGCFSQHEGMMADAALEARPVTMPAQKAGRFPRTARLLRHADFERVYKQGRRHFSASMTVFYWPRPQADRVDEETRAGAPAPQGLRVGFTVGRMLGGAVQRNRIKRRMREAVRMTRPVAGVAADMVINPKKALLTADFSDVLNEVKRAFAVIEEKLSQQAASERSNRSAGA